MTDIVDRLRSEVTIGSGTVSPLRLAAADEIERLRFALGAIAGRNHWRDNLMGDKAIAAVYLGLAMVIARASLKAEQPNASELGDLISGCAQDEFAAWSRSSRAN